MGLVDVDLALEDDSDQRLTATVHTEKRGCATYRVAQNHAGNTIYGLPSLPYSTSAATYERRP